jgi:MoxR-like ATPase
MVIATQNPIEQAGTYRLPEAQLDRFLMKTSLGYPDHETTVRLLGESAQRDRASTVTPLITAKALTDMAHLAAGVHTEHAILTYAARLAEETRQAPELRLGMSVRGAMAYVRAAKVWAASQGREYVIPDDIKVLARPVLSHRLLLQPEAEFGGATVDAVIDRIMAEVQPPTGALV